MKWATNPEYLLADKLLAIFCVLLASIDLYQLFTCFEETSFQEARKPLSSAEELNKNGEIFSPEPKAKRIKPKEIIKKSKIQGIKTLNKKPKLIEIDVKRTIRAIDKQIALIDFTFSNITPQALALQKNTLFIKIDRPIYFIKLFFYQIIIYTLPYLPFMSLAIIVLSEGTYLALSLYYTKKFWYLKKSR